MGIMKLLGTAFNTILDGGNPTADRTITFPDKSGQTALTSDVIGVNQTWQDVKASRVLGTTYTNDTGKPIALYVTFISGATGAQVKITVNDLEIGRSNSMYTGAAVHSVSFIVPAGNTYVITNAIGSSTINNWSELR